MRQSYIIFIGLIFGNVNCTSATKVDLQKTDDGSVKICNASEFDFFDFLFSSGDIVAKKYGVTMKTHPDGGKRGIELIYNSAFDNARVEVVATPVIGTDDRNQEVRGIHLIGSGTGTVMNIGHYIESLISNTLNQCSQKFGAKNVRNVQEVPFTTKCSNCRIIVEVNSLGEVKPNKKNAYITPSAKEVSRSDLLFQEYAKHLSVALQKKGYNIVESEKKSDVVVFLNYGISSPNVEKNTYSKPVFHTTYIPPAQYSVSGNVTNSFDFTKQYNVNMNFMENGIGTLNTQYAGQETWTETKISYTRIISIDALDYQEFKRKKIVPHWSTSIISVGKSDDLRRVFPQMINTAKDHIGSNTGTKINLSGEMR